jgi:hypothetical protein
MHKDNDKRALIVATVWMAISTLLAPLASAEEAASSSEPIDPEDIPAVHNTFYQVPEGVVGWDVLGVMDIEIEVLGPLQTNATKTFSEAVRALDGETVKVMGFLYPLKGGVTHDYFLLTAWPPSCPFCLPAGPTMMVETFAAEAIDFTEGAIVMAGQFELLENDPSGFFYRLQSAELVERFDDIRWNGMESLQPGLQ